MSKGTIVGILNESEVTRRALLKKAEEITGTRIIAYIANPNASPNFIDHNDPPFMNDILESVGRVERLDLIIESPGGEPNIAEKLATMFREFCSSFRVIVLNSAKSAATMVAISSDKILMGYLSEIGPIDPQIRLISPQGQVTFVPAQSIIDSLPLLDNAIKSGIDPRVAIALIQKIDPSIVDVANKAMLFSKVFAKEWLGKYMFKHNQQKAQEIADALSDNRRWLSHGKRIGFGEAQQLGLNVELIDRGSELWKVLWEYYSRALIHLNNTGTIKLFESKDLGMNFTVRAGRPPTPTRPAETGE